MEMKEVVLGIMITVGAGLTLGGVKWLFGRMIDTLDAQFNELKIKLDVMGAAMQQDREDLTAHKLEDKDYRIDVLQRFQTKAACENIRHDMERR